MALRRIAAIAALLLVAMNGSASPADRQSIADSEKILRMCLDTVPDRGAIEASLKSYGLQLKFRTSSTLIYAASSWKIAVAVPTDGQYCTVLVHRMPVSAANTLAISLSKEIGAKPTSKFSKALAHAAYVGSKGKRRIRIEVAKELNVDLLRGSGVAVGLD